MFVTEESVAVSDEAGNVICVRAKMGRGVEARVSADFAELGGRSQLAYELCLLRHNIVSWEGPAFTNAKGETILVTRRNVDRLDSAEPLIALVVQKIGELNRSPSPPEPLPAQNGNGAKKATTEIIEAMPSEHPTTAASG